ncbi:heat shock factor protein-like isoform X2 [Fopius arisanus]|uniref:Heat shock factor protein-like isoform X2 n=1 Tax=Fopius arisanus TaxID=64838 RepID=A0A9R1TBE6_9HYME|nr:PREDICTED: heat shock factor protein-like isoform X2 [Fopius arisanus]
MHTVMEAETSVPAFLGKLWRLVEDPETDDLICWSPNGRSFFIRNPSQFARELLPHYYKHNNMASFVRQLNMYGFHKKVSVELGGLKCDRDEMEFAHQYFIKDNSYLLEHIKRKIANKPQESCPSVKSEMMTKVLSEVRTMRGRQEHLDTRLGAMKRENEALWRELAMLRRKHLKQQEIVNKLIHFLVTLVQPGRGGGLSVKRRYPLMIDDHQRIKHRKMSKPEASPTGPTIHELDGEHEQDLDSEYIVAEILENHTPAIQSPASIDSPLDEDNAETVYHIADETVDREIQLLEAQEAAAKNLNIKPKPKRKNKMPVKILIPSTQAGEEPRQETLLLEVNDEDTDLPVALLEKKTKEKPKAVPSKTVRSSKLTAMAANINKLNSGDDSDDVEDSREKSEDLNDGLIISDVKSQESKLTEKNGGGSGDQGQAALEVNPGSSDKRKDLSLSRVSPSGTTDNNYREEMDNHLETMQNELDNLRDILRGEGYSIDANTLLGLFGGDDPMSFGIPMNPELDPTQQDRDDDGELSDGNNCLSGGELMAYNPSSNLLDFDDDIFLGSNPANSPGIQPTSPNLYSPNDLQDIDDNKAGVLEALVRSHGNSSTTS